MGEQVDRRGFLRSLRRSQPTPDAPDVAPEAERELTPKERQIAGLAEFTTRLLDGVATEDEERLADGPLLTRAYDQAYMRVTVDHIVSNAATGFSSLIRTSDVRAFNTQPPVHSEGHGALVTGVLHAHHPGDPPAITRSHAFLFPVESPLIGAIRTACDIPEPEPDAEEIAVPDADADVGEGEVT